MQFRLAGINGIMGAISVNLPHKSTLVAARNNTKYQIFHYTRGITPKRVTSLRGAHLRVIAPVGNTVFDLTSPRFEPRTFRSRDERVTARLTGR